MKFKSRKDVELTGKAGLETIKDERGTRSKYLNSFWLYTDPDDLGFAPHGPTQGFWESWISFWMTDNVPAGVDCMDIGANHGYYAFVLADQDCRVVAVEPQGNLCNLMHMSIEKKIF